MCANFPLIILLVIDHVSVDALGGHQHQSGATVALASIDNTTPVTQRASSLTRPFPKVPSGLEQRALAALREGATFDRRSGARPASPFTT